MDIKGARILTNLTQPNPTKMKEIIAWLMEFKGENSKTLLVGAVVGVVAYIASEQDNKEQRPIKILFRAMLGLFMAYFLPERIMSILSTFFQIKDVAVDAVLTIAAIFLGYFNADAVKIVANLIKNKTEKNGNS